MDRNSGLIFVIGNLIDFPNILADLAWIYDYAVWNLAFQAASRNYKLVFLSKKIPFLNQIPQKLPCHNTVIFQ